MQYYSRKIIKPQDLNAHGTLFGGAVLSWIDEEAAVFVLVQLGKGNIVTKYMSEINFVNSAALGEVIEIGMELVSFGRTSVTVKCEVRTKFERKVIITIDKIVFVHVDEFGKPTPHFITKPVHS